MLNYQRVTTSFAHMIESEITVRFFSQCLRWKKESWELEKPLNRPKKIWRKRESFNNHNKKQQTPKNVEEKAASPQLTLDRHRGLEDYLPGDEWCPWNRCDFSYSIPAKNIHLHIHLDIVSNQKL